MIIKSQNLALSSKMRIHNVLKLIEFSHCAKSSQRKKGNFFWEQSIANFRHQFLVTTINVRSKGTKSTNQRPTTQRRTTTTAAILCQPLVNTRTELCVFSQHGKLFMANRSANRRVTDPRLDTENHKKWDLLGVCQNVLLSDGI